MQFSKTGAFPQIVVEFSPGEFLSLRHAIKEAVRVFSNGRNIDLINPSELKALEIMEPFLEDVDSFLKEAFGD